MLSPERQADNRYRYFTDADARRISFIQKAQKLGFTLKEIHNILNESTRGKSPCPLVREIVQRRVIENAKRLDEMMQLQRNMERALRQWKEMPDSAPDGHAICHLIETHDQHKA